MNALNIEMLKMTVLRLKWNAEKRMATTTSATRNGKILCDAVACMLWHFEIGSKVHFQYGFMHDQFEWYAIKIEIKPKINCYYLSLASFGNWIDWRWYSWWVISSIRVAYCCMALFMWTKRCFWTCDISIFVSRRNCIAMTINDWFIN